MAIEKDHALIDNFHLHRVITPPIQEEGAPRERPIVADEETRVVWSGERGGKKIEIAMGAIEALPHGVDTIVAPAEWLFVPSQTHASQRRYTNTDYVYTSGEEQVRAINERSVFNAAFGMPSVDVAALAEASRLEAINPVVGESKINALDDEAFAQGVSRLQSITRLALQMNANHYNGAHVFVDAGQLRRAQAAINLPNGKEQRVRIANELLVMQPVWFETVQQKETSRRLQYTEGHAAYMARAALTACSQNHERVGATSDSETRNVHSSGSVAIPAFGLNYGLSLEESIRGTARAVAEFFAANPSTSIERVTIVLQDIPYLFPPIPGEDINRTARVRGWEMETVEKALNI